MYTLNGSTTDFYKKAVSVARHYGFVSFEETKGTQPARVGSSQNRAALPASAEQKKMDPLGSAFTSLLCKAIEKNIVPSKEPILIYDMGQINASKARFTLSLIGARGSIAEAIILKAAYAILEENNIARTAVHINSIGDRDSSAKFGREAGVYLRRNFADLSEDARTLLKDDVFAALAYLRQNQYGLLSDLPRSVEFLSSASRKHLREVIDFLEIAGIPYELDNFVIGHRDAFTQALFEIHPHDADDSTAEPLGRGGRLDEFTKRLARTAIPSVSMTISLATNAKDKTSAALSPAQHHKPLLYFIHVGFEAKLRSLQVIEVFRKAHIPFHQSLHQDKLTDQLAYAERLAAPYIVIMGHKEALENQVIVRNASTRAQQIMSVDMLPSFFKHASRR